MNYKETLEWLFAQLPMYQREGKAAYKANLDNTLKLDEYFGSPHKQFKTVHVGGTNGKGSVSHMLASILQEAGYKTGLYTCSDGPVREPDIGPCKRQGSNTTQ